MRQWYYAARKGGRVQQQRQLLESMHDDLVGLIHQQCEPAEDLATVVIACTGLTLTQLKTVNILCTYNMPLRMAIQYALMPPDKQRMYGDMSDRWPQAFKRVYNEVLNPPIANSI